MHANDNILSKQLQGHSGVIKECRRPHANYHGSDSFTYAISNGTRESNLGKASVTVK